MRILARTGLFYEKTGSSRSVIYNSPAHCCNGRGCVSNILIKSFVFHSKVGKNPFLPGRLLCVHNCFQFIHEILTAFLPTQSSHLAPQPNPNYSQCGIASDLFFISPRIAPAFFCQKNEKISRKPLDKWGGVCYTFKRMGRYIYTQTTTEEKPCGGGMTDRQIQVCPEGQEDDL